MLKANPDRADAWKGLISTLLATNRNAEALQEIALIPAPVRKQLENDIEFVQSEASIYAATGDIPHAVEYMNRVQAHYAQAQDAAAAEHRHSERMAALQHRRTIALSIRR